MKKKLIKYMMKIERQYYKDNNIDILCLLKNILQKIKLIYQSVYVTYILSHFINNNKLSI